MTDKPKTRRFFFALWPDEETCHQVSQTVMPQLQNLNGRKVTQHQWHITLAFLGNVSDDMLNCVQRQADQVSGGSFELSLDTVGHWTRPKVAWLGCSQTPEPLSHLVQNLNQHLKVCGYSPEYKDFKAHMTLMRKVSRKPKPLEFQPITLSVNEFVLVESKLDKRGSEYSIIERWKFAS